MCPAAQIIVYALLNSRLLLGQVQTDKKPKKTPTVVESKKQDVTGADVPVSEIQPSAMSNQPILSQPGQVAASSKVAPASGVHTRSGAGAQTGGQT